MSKITIFIIIIIIIGVVVYLKLFLNNSENTMKENTENVNNRQVEISEIQKIVDKANPENSFDIPNAKQLIIQYFEKASNEKVTKEILIDDINTINEITSILKTLPTKGEESIKMGPDINYTSVIFLGDDNKNYSIEIYGNMIKTPASSFYSKDKYEGEKIIVDKIKSLLENKKTESNLSEIQKRVNEANAETTFDMKNCNEMIIQYFEHAINEQATKEFIITDKETINTITENLNKLPEDGEMFVSFTSEVEYKKATFFCENNKNYSISIYGGSLQSPGTSFYADEHPEEKIVINKIKELINNN